MINNSNLHFGSQYNYKNDVVLQQARDVINETTDQPVLTDDPKSKQDALNKINVDLENQLLNDFYQSVKIDINPSGSNNNSTFVSSEQIQDLQAQITQAASTSRDIGYFQGFSDTYSEIARAVKNGDFDVASDFMQRLIDEDPYKGTDKSFATSLNFEEIKGYIDRAASGTLKDGESIEDLENMISEQAMQYEQEAIELGYEDSRITAEIQDAIAKFRDTTNITDSKIVELMLQAVEDSKNFTKEKMQAQGSMVSGMDFSKIDFDKASELIA